MYDFTKIMKDRVDEICLNDLSICPNDLWKQVCQEMNEKAKLWRGLTNAQVYTRAKNKRAQNLGTDLYRKIEEPDISRVKNSKHDNNKSFILLWSSCF